jgi:AraC-like DNA-binding protein
VRALLIVRSFERLENPALCVEEVCEAVGLSPTTLHDPAARVPRRVLDDLYDEAARRTGDPDIGLHVSELAQPELYGALGYAVLSSPNMRAAFEQLQAYAAAVLEGEGLELHAAGDTARFVYRVLDGDAPSRHRVEGFLGVVFRFSFHALAAPSYRPWEVRFRHPMPVTGAREHERIFGAPVRFEQADNEAVFAADLLDQPFPRHEPTLHEVAQQSLRVLSDLHRTRETVAGRVRELLLARATAGRLHSESIARELGMSARTLQRRLSQEHSSLSQIADELRHSLAPRYLESEGASIPEISERLGFESVSSFYRAFGRWTGVTPAAWRRRSIR